MFIVNNHMSNKNIYMTSATENAFIASAYFELFVDVLEKRFEEQFNGGDPFDIEDVFFDLPDSDTPFDHFISNNRLGPEELIVLFITILPHIDIAFLDRIIKEKLPDTGDFPLLGGIRGKNSRGFLPTGETAMFLLAGSDINKRIQYQKIFETEHLFNKLNVLWLEEVPDGEPKMSGRIILSSEYLELFITGKLALPKTSMNFPAQHIRTQMEWSDLVLNEQTFQQISDLQNWVLHHHILMQDVDMKRKLKPGYRALFHGPPGTGKTLTAMLLGKYTGKDVFRIDLSMVVSKFIGETEKNLSQLFSRAENKNWILFFDEADALFSKRTNVRDAHDKYANQEAAYLLQRIESFNGLVILATNFKNNIDEAFIRRFQAVVQFSLPSVAERVELWKRAFPSSFPLEKEVPLLAIAKKYEVTGSDILNIVHYCCLQAISKKLTAIDHTLLIAGIRKEFLKEGRIWE
jgi:hypothetical protein